MGTLLRQFCGPLETASPERHKCEQQDQVLLLTLSLTRLRLRLRKSVSPEEALRTIAERY